jgi:hypothetical protein
MGFSGQEDSSSGTSFRRFLSRAEALTLLGMILCIVSLFLAWPVPLEGKLPATPLVISLTRTGAYLPLVRWPVTAGAILSGLLLAFPPSRNNRMPMAALQGLGGLVCFVIALTHFAIQPGVLVDLLGGALITFGAVDRFSEQPK